MQELLDYCGRRGIAKLQVSCNHAMRKTLTSPSMTQAEQRSLQQRAKTSMDKLYRVSLDQNQIRKISNWRTTALSQVAALMTVEYDGLTTLTIDSTMALVNDGQDPNDILKF
jgi:hypothetical protein